MRGVRGGATKGGGGFSFHVFAPTRPPTPPPPLVLSFAASLPPWAHASIYDPARPVAAQVSSATRVLIPATAPRTVVSAAIDAAPRLALITQPASGHDNVDLALAASRGVPVCTAPGVNAASVAEAAVMALLMVARRVDAARAALAARRLGDPLGTQLAGKHALIVGAGAIGGRVARVCEAMGMRVATLTSASTRADLLAALPAAHAVLVHVPLTPATRRMFDGGAFDACRRGALFVNFSRGGVVDEASLLAALNDGTVAGAGLDVFETEPVDPASPLAAHPSVVALPHIGVATEEVWVAYRDLLVSNIEAAREGGALKGQVGVATE